MFTLVPLDQMSDLSHEIRGVNYTQRLNVRDFFLSVQQKRRKSFENKMQVQDTLIRCSEIAALLISLASVPNLSVHAMLAGHFVPLCIYICLVS